MKKITSKLRQEHITAAAEKIVMVLAALSVIDTVLAALGGSYLSQNVGTFLGKSRVVILSDLLFLEGAFVFAIGAILAFLTIGMPSKPPKDSEYNAQQPTEKRLHPSIILMIIGTCLIGLSIMIGTLLI